MQNAPSTKTSLSAFAIGLLTIIPVFIAWVIRLRAGPRLDGFTGGPMVIAVPFLLFIYSIVWLIIREVAPKFFRLTFASVLASSAVSMYMAVSVLCGPVACFAQSPNRNMGFFLVAGAILFAGVHHLIISKNKT